MNPAHRLFRLFGLGRDPVAEVDDELELHVALRAAEFQQQGLSATEARKAALRAFGDLPATRGALVESARRDAPIRRRR